MSVESALPEAPVWIPSQELREACCLSAFIECLERKGRGPFPDYESLHIWSVRAPEEFWEEALEFLSIQYEGSPSPVMTAAEIPVPLARSWFPNLRLNFAENILRRDGDTPALVSWSENVQQRSLSWNEMRSQVSGLQSWLREQGIGEGDRIFGYLPNIPEAISSMLAAASLGAIWSSCGTDYQLDGLIARIHRVQPKVLVAARHYIWRGKVVSTKATLEEVLRVAPSVTHVVCVDYLQQVGSEGEPLSFCGTAVPFHSLPQSTKPNLSYKKLPFSHPLYIMFSSGTTGVPKGIVHSAGGVLLEQLKELVLHCDVRPGDKLMYQTSTSWMMWNWMVSAMGGGATLALYDGDPMLEDGYILWRMVEEEKITHYGTSAAFLHAIEKRGVVPNSRYRFPLLRSLLSTGSTLLPSQFDYLLSSVGPLWIQSISGGTDILGCFALGSPIKPVYRGALQSKSLGYDVQVYSPEAKRVIEEEGELVCVAPAPSMPIYFLNDASGAQYSEAYFNDFPGVWRHGDRVEEKREGHLYFRGRSDATLKPGGIRISTADIYGAIAHLIYLEGALAVGYTPATEVTERIVLFVVPKEGLELTQACKDEISECLRRINVYYVPALILPAEKLPKTANNKLAEIAVKRILAGEEPGNRSALANPESLDFFEKIARAQVQSKLG